mmetsp:Transcript_30445/g.78843  ORF Transcript_30445/g.78843 Transcript_30445/m.78843 type:complete len:248 (-) Transcript_30445:1573-2316(-)
MTANVVGRDGRIPTLEVLDGVVTAHLLSIKVIEVSSAGLRYVDDVSRYAGERHIVYHIGVEAERSDDIGRIQRYIVRIPLPSSCRVTPHYCEVVDDAHIEAEVVVLIPFHYLPVHALYHTSKRFIPPRLVQRQIRAEKGEESARKIGAAHRHIFRYVRLRYSRRVNLRHRYVTPVLPSPIRHTVTRPCICTFTLPNEFPIFVHALLRHRYVYSEPLYLSIRNVPVHFDAIASHIGTGRLPVFSTFSR